MSNLRGRKPSDAWFDDQNKTDAQNTRQSGFMKKDIDSSNRMLEDLIIDEFNADDPRDLFKPNVTRYSQLTDVEKVEHDIQAFFFLNGNYKDQPDEFEKWDKLFREIYGEDKKLFEKSAKTGEKTAPPVDNLKGQRQQVNKNNPSGPPKNFI